MSTMPRSQFDDDYGHSVDIAGVCFILVLLLAIIAVAYGLGKLGEKTVIQEVQPSYHSGLIPSGVPIWAIYEDDGALTALSALKVDDGRLFLFSIESQPVKFEILPDPKAWTEMSAGILEVLR